MIHSLGGGAKAGTVPNDHFSPDIAQVMVPMFLPLNQRVSCTNQLVNEKNGARFLLDYHGENGIIRRKVQNLCEF